MQYAHQDRKNEEFVLQFGSDILLDYTCTEIITQLIK